jgi:glycosyltransferase involved in cell wall biosynthesis
VILLSVITINKNNATGLRRTLDSLQCLLPHLTTVQLLFVDGMSNDNSITLANEFYPRGAILIEQDRGPYDAMNKGLLMAIGKYSFWLNSGDEFLSSCLPRLFSLLRNSTSSIVCCGTTEYNPRTRIESAKYSGLWQLPHSSLNHQSIFIRTSDAKEVGGYSGKYKIAADRDLVLRILAYKRSIEEHEVLVSRYYHGGISSNYFMLHKEHLAISLQHHIISRQHYLISLLLLYIRMVKAIFAIRLKSSHLASLLNSH